LKGGFVLAEELSELLQNRRRKLDEIREKGVNPFPYRFSKTHGSQDVLAGFEKLEQEKTTVAFAGRIISKRDKGKTSFAHVLDENGKLQIYVRKDEIGDAAYEIYLHFDLGDIIGVSGPVFKTHTGEISLQVKQVELLAKSLHPLPVIKEKVVDGEKVVFDQVTDKEARYRQRYVDLNVNYDIRETFKKRSRIIRLIRQFLDTRGFLEVETPALQPLYGGAAARPFKTHHNALNMPLFLRISDELYLKRLIVGGLEKVYEIGKDFRNEGMDRSHNPEFTMMEIYQAYADYHDMMDLVEGLIAMLAREVRGKTLTSYQGREIDLTPPWPRVTFTDIIKQHTNIDITGMDTAALRQACKQLGIETTPEMDKGELLDEIFSTKAEHHLVRPTFITDYPVETTPLAKRHRSNPALVERFELFINGQELANAFSELNDPIDQRKRFEEMRANKTGDAGVLDEDFLRAMEYGMPPTGGLGIGIDRLVMFLTDSFSIRDVLFFPQMKPEDSQTVVEIQGAEAQRHEGTK
jgi:lysyl-tRNA synthetase class 2